VLLLIVQADLLYVVYFGVMSLLKHKNIDNDQSVKITITR